MITVIKRINKYFEKYFRDEISLEDLGHNLSSEIGSLSDHQLEMKLLKLDSEIDSILFTISKEKQRREVEKVFEIFCDNILE